MPEMKSRPQLEARALASRKHTVRNVDGVLQVEEGDSLFQNDIADLVKPDGQAVFQPELAQIIRARQMKLAAGALLAA